MTRTIVWFRGKDLRIADHRPLRAALEGGEMIPLFVLDPYFFAKERAQRIAHRISFLLESLAALSKNLEDLGSRLIVVSGKSTEVIPELARAWKADRVVGQRWTEPFARERDRRIENALSVRFDLFEGETLLKPGTLRTGGRTPYSVFTPFSRAVRAASESIGAPLPAPKKLPPVPRDVVASGGTLIPSLGDLGIVPNPRVLHGGEAAARDRLKTFFKTKAVDYASARDRMDVDGTSRLSADLKFGLVSPRTVWSAATRDAGPHARTSFDTFQNELIWREFAYHTLWDRPEVLTEPFRRGFTGFPWRDESLEWQAWIEGKTGYPVVDAAARQLLAEGFVHNRARMIAASFLTKHLMIDYRRGEAHYLRFLTDGDWASNNLGWQWSAGCGSDAQPYFRIFNPVTQGKKFDPEGAYVKKYLPELSGLSVRYIHEPWKAPASALREAGVTLGEDYPEPIVDHGEARVRYLAMARSHLAGSR